MKIQLLIGQVTNIVDRIATNVPDIQNGYQAIVACVCAICIAWVLTSFVKG